jgi:hypothetical protein
MGNELLAVRVSRAQAANECDNVSMTRGWLVPPQEGRTGAVPA